MTPPADRLYRAHAPALFRYLVLMTGDEHLAEDVLHDTFGRLLERPPADDANLRGWLFRVATNRLHDVWRRDGRRRLALRATRAEGAHGDPPPAADRRLLAAETRRLANRALQALNPRDRAILLMREEGFRHREIAEAVGTTTKSVGTLIARALDRVTETVAELEQSA